MNSGNQYVFDCRTRSKKATGINPKYIKKFKWFESSRKWTCTQGFFSYLETSSKELYLSRRGDSKSKSAGVEKGI